MFAYIVRRVIQGIGVALLVSFLCFFLFQYVGDPVLTMVGKNATPKQMEEVRSMLGLDKPFYIQYLTFVKNAFRGDFGRSYTNDLPVFGLILERAPATIELATSAMIIATFFGIGLGVLVSLNRAAVLSRLVMAGSLLGISLPTFLIGLLFIMIFAVNLQVLPVFGRGDVITIGFWRTGLLTLSGIKHLILPALTLGLYQMALYVRLTRAEVTEVLEQDYVRTAWAKGLPGRVVIFKHALRNSLIPVVTMIGLGLGELIAFATITETIFQWPGMCRLFLSSIYGSDYPVIVAYIVLMAFVILFINLAVDIFYTVLNPKIQYD